MRASGIEVLFLGSNFARLLEGLWVTVRISLLAVLLSLPLGILFGLFMTLQNPVARAVSRVYLEFIRIMPQLVLLFIAYFGVTRAFGWNWVHRLLRRDKGIRLELGRGIQCRTRFYTLGNGGNGGSGARRAQKHSAASV